MFATFPPSAGGAQPASGAAQFFTLTLDDETVFQSLERETDDGTQTMPVLSVNVPAGTETIKIVNVITGDHPQAGDFSYFMPVIEVDTTADVVFNFVSFGLGPNLFLSLAPYLVEGETLQVNGNRSSAHVRILDGKYEEVRNFPQNVLGTPSWVGGINYFPATPSTKNGGNFNKTAAGPGTVLYKGFGRPPNGSSFRDSGVFVYASVTAAMTLRFALSTIEGSPRGTLDLEFVPGQATRVTATPDEAWTEQVFPEIGSGIDYLSAPASWVKTLTVLSGTGDIFGDIGFQGGEANATFDY